MFIRRRVPEAGPLKAAVIGVGAFGRHHATKYQAMNGVDLSKSPTRPFRPASRGLHEVDTSAQPWQPVRIGRNRFHGVLGTERYRQDHAREAPDRGLRHLFIALYRRHRVQDEPRENLSVRASAMVHKGYGATYDMLPGFAAKWTTSCHCSIWYKRACDSGGVERECLPESKACMPRYRLSSGIHHKPCFANPIADRFPASRRPGRCAAHLRCFLRGVLRSASSRKGESPMRWPTARPLPRLRKSR